MLSLAIKSVSVWTAHVVGGEQWHVPSEPILAFDYGLTNSFVRCNIILRMILAFKSHHVKWKIKCIFQWVK